MMRDTIIEDITIESATVTQGRDGDQWKITAQVPSLRSKYPVGPLWKQVKANELLKKGDRSRVRLTRGTQKSNTSGDHEYDYFWELAEWNVQADLTPAQPASIDQRIAWNSAINNAVALLAPSYDRNDSPQVLQGDILSLAHIIYGVITGGPQEMPGKAPESHAQPPGEEPLPFEPEAPARAIKAKPRDIAPGTDVCSIPEHNQTPLLTVAGTGRKGHPFKNAKNQTEMCYGD